MKMIEHAAISAAAGSGKTYQLTNRFIRLLHLFEQPERIIALTFTRAAAGEFFRSILSKLCHAAGSPEAARALSAQLQIDADAARYHHLLRLLIRSSHRLNLQTLDSFFFRLAEALSPELGLGGQLTLLDESEIELKRNQVRDRLIHYDRKTDAAIEPLWHGFNQATFGTDMRSVERTLSDFIQRLFDLYVEAPDLARWQGGPAIWPQGNPWLIERDTKALGDRLLALLPDDLKPAQRKDFEHLVAFVIRYPLERPDPSTLFNRVLEEWDNVCAGTVALKVRRGVVDLTGEACAALHGLVAAVIGCELERALATTAGAHQVLQAYDQLYDRMVRLQGKLYYADILLTLANLGDHSPLRYDAQSRWMLEYRLDGLFDHWLLDEFQDTSRAQWSAIENLVDEVIQDPSGTRSFFYVGDTKQCLYLWRNSDDRLFHEIYRRYSIPPTSLSTSWRSAPPVLDMVDTVFADPGCIEDLFAADVRQRWDDAWETHTSSAATSEMPGFAVWMAADEADETRGIQRILEVLEALEPVRRGLTVAVLARSNKDVLATADYLRNHLAVPVRTGSAIHPATDNPAGVALLSFLRFIAHPGDTMAQRHLEMIGLAHGRAARRAFLERFASHGPELAVRGVCDSIATLMGADDAFLKDRMARLVEATRRFAASSDHSIDFLIRFLEHNSISESPAEGAIVVETIHKAKGLEYDCVLLLENQKRAAVAHDMHIKPCRNAAGAIDWILKPIKKSFLNADPELARLSAQEDGNKAYGDLCTLYVAMTRAKRALYVVTDTDRIQRGSIVDLLRQRLGGGETETDAVELFQGAAFPVIWSSGDPAWYHGIEPPAPRPGGGETPPRRASGIAATPRLHVDNPSAADERARHGGYVFSASREAADLGTEVHALFERIEWLPDPARALDDRLAENASEAAAQLRACLADPHIQTLFKPPDESVELWREKPFLVVTESGHLLNGVFDRVHLLTRNGKPVAAHIIDFKTDRVNGEGDVERIQARHRHQLHTYRLALSRITGLPENAIDTSLLLTRLPLLATVS